MTEVEERAPARRFTVTPAIELLVLGVAVAVAIASYFVLTGEHAPQRLLTPLLVALLLVANLLPGVALLVLLGRRVARRRAARSPVGGNGQLHVRLVALFSIIAAVPLVLVTIFASLLFQYGVEFWFSDKARGMLENASTLAQESYQQMLSAVDKENVAMASDLSRALTSYRWLLDSREFAALFAQDVYQRSLSEGVVFSVLPSGEIRTEVLVNPYDRDLSRDIKPSMIATLRRGAPSVPSTSSERTQSVTRIAGTPLYLYAARVSGAQEMTTRMNRARVVLSDYHALQSRSRALQLKFNAALLLVSLLIVGIAVWIALAVADRLVRPVGELVAAARQVAAGDLAARVRTPRTQDELGTLATAFNRMTDRLQKQNSALVTANDQLDARRALIEAVMAGVSAGVLATGGDGTVRIANNSAQRLLGADGDGLVGKPLGQVAPELGAMVQDGTRDAVVEVGPQGEQKTLAVRMARTDAGPILTFDDITQQVQDQRRAAWADVARRIAHEIKNPLTPIQLAAERLQRRYGSKVESDGTFARLTDTIIRQVADLRRMVDEFSSFARMPKPVFRPEPLVDTARQVMFLHEVAHPAIRFTFVHDEPGPMLVCDRRQIGQALTNIVKNAIEAIEARGQDGGTVTLRIDEEPGVSVSIEVEDDGIGLPPDRDRIVEPYMTTRARGTGLGLAIVKKIVEEHCGTIGFADRPGGGTRVVMRFDVRALTALDHAPAEPELAVETRPDLHHNRT